MCIRDRDEEDLSYMVRKLNEEGLEINIKKTEYFAIRDEETTDLEVDENVKIRGTDKFKYLGSTLSKQGKT